MLMMAALMLLASCGTQIPTQTKLGDAKLGPKPSRDVAIAAASTWLKNRFPQDDLSRMAFGSIEPGYYAEARGNNAQRFAWMLFASVDAKNDYGLYEGAKPYHFYFLGSQLVGCAFPSSTWNGREYRGTYAVAEMNGGGLTRTQAGLAEDHSRPPGT